MPEKKKEVKKVNKVKKVDKEVFNVPSVEEMVKAGVHFGHQVKRWHPAMERFIFSTDKKTHVIDVEQTRSQLKKACEFLYEVARSNGQIVIVGTKRQAADIVEVKAKECGALFVNERWLGGTFTNFKSIEANWKELNQLVQKRAAGEFSHYTKKERLLIDRKIEKLEIFVGGIRDLKKYPEAIVVIDAKREKTAIREAIAVGVTVIAIVDTNTDPLGIDYIIPANDDAIKSIELLLDTFSTAIKTGYNEKESKK